jgi:hypothetical protein
MPTLDEWKALFVEGLDYANKHASFFAAPNKELSEFQTLAATTATDMNQFMTAVTLRNGAWMNSFDAPKSIKYPSTNFAIGEGHTETYMVVGTFDDFAFLFCPARMEVAPPAVVSKWLDDPSQAVVWNLFGGFGFRTGVRGGGKWTPFPFRWLQGDYTSKADGFLLSVREGDMTINCELRDRDWFSFDVKFGTTVLSGRVKALGPPLPMSKNGCFSCGTYGLQSKYYQRTDCAVNADLQLDTESFRFRNGHGWIDHQSYYVAPGRSLARNLMGNSLLILYKQKLSWLWMYVQDRHTSTQYMIVQPINPHKFKEGNVYKASCNVYNTNRVQFNVKGAKVRVGKTVIDRDFNYPIEYYVTLPSQKQVTLRALYGYGAHPNATRIDSWEMPAVLFDAQEREIGSGLIELNGTTPDDVHAKRLIANMSPEAIKRLQTP